MYRAARGLYNVPQVISAAHSPQGPSGGQARPAQSASDDAPSRALHMAPRSVAHAACHSPAKRGASAGLYAPPATTFLSLSRCASILSDISRSSLTILDLTSQFYQETMWYLSGNSLQRESKCLGILSLILTIQSILKLPF